jgi:hypothetical protein
MRWQSGLQESFLTMGAPSVSGMDQSLSSPITQCYRKTDNVVTRCIAGQTLLVPVTASVADLNSVFVLNEIGTLIWAQIDGQTSVARIVEGILADYEVEAPARTSVLEFMDSLQEAKLIRQ